MLSKLTSYSYRDKAKRQIGKTKDCTKFFDLLFLYYKLFLLFLGNSPSPTKKEDSLLKIGHAQSKELLQLFDIRGTSVARIQAFGDFKKFVSIDDAGIVYILQEISNKF